VAQFRPFVEDPNGWRNDDWWTRAGLKDRGNRTEPYLWDDPQWRIDNHPVVGVMWYAAAAYCRWLTERLKVEGLTLNVWREGQIETLNVQGSTLVRLLTEAEWEWAARVSPLSQEERGGALSLPLGEGWDEGGLYDLAGNVWEWCSTSGKPTVTITPRSKVWTNGPTSIWRAQMVVLFAAVILAVMPVGRGARFAAGITRFSAGSGIWGFAASSVSSSGF
jgi:formylglycine-generating enzyme required for sulfatase activity